VTFVNATHLGIEGTVLGPHDLKIACQAFDGAWVEIIARFPDQIAVQTARDQLARIVMALRYVTKDPAEMQAIAVQKMVEQSKP
jgi:hypothetical protein